MQRSNKKKDEEKKKKEEVMKKEEVKKCQDALKKLVDPSVVSLAELIHLKKFVGVK